MGETAKYWDRLRHITSSQNVHSRIVESLDEGCHVSDSHLAKSMSFFHSCKERVVAYYSKPWKANSSPVFNKYFYIVSSIGNLLIHKFDCLVRGRNKRIMEE